MRAPTPSAAGVVGKCDEIWEKTLGKRANLFHPLPCEFHSIAIFLFVYFFFFANLAKKNPLYRLCISYALASIFLMTGVELEIGNSNTYVTTNGAEL